MEETNAKEMLSIFDPSIGKAYYKKKWYKEHKTTIILCTVAWSVLMLALRKQNVEMYPCCTIGGLLAIIYYVVLHGRMRRYIENNMQMPYATTMNEGESDK